MLCERAASREVAHSRGEGVALARIGCKGLCRGDELCLSDIELMGKLYLQVRLNLTKKSRHVTRGGFSRSLIQQTMDKLLRVQLLAVRRIHGCQDECRAHEWSLSIFNVDCRV
jgi:hypothetical protein